MSLMFKRIYDIIKSGVSPIGAPGAIKGVRGDFSIAPEKLKHMASVFGPRLLITRR
jgi:hypothetical protein